MVGTPAIVESSTSTDVFLRNTSSLLVHVHDESGAPLAVERFPGALAGDPAAIVNGSDIDVVGVGGSTQLYHWSKVGSGVAVIEATDTETPVVGPPVLLSSGDPSALDVFVRRIDGGVQHIFKRGAVWLTERASDAEFRGFPAGALTADGNLHMFARGMDDALKEVVLPVSATVATDVPVAHTIGTAPAMAGSPSAIVDPATNDVYVVTRSPSGDVNLLTLAAKSAWAQKVVKRPAGAAPSKGTAGFTFSPIVVPGALFARAQEGGAWSYAFEKGWTWEHGLLR